MFKSSVFIKIKQKILNYKKFKPLSSFSQEGEDLVLSRIFHNKPTGFYVDIGAHHPARFSNTYKFYKAGWRGINVEPNPDYFNLFTRYRPRDTNLNFGIAKENGSLEYFMFDEPALNTFDGKILEDRIVNTSYKHLKTIQIDVKPLAQVLNEHVPHKIKIDFLSIDVEGFDLDVIKSNDWVNFRPSWVLVEQLKLENIEQLDFEMHHYMKSIGYILFAKTFNTLFYKDARI
jgi:FkbM family methyltransferase